jgi:hypothetical protein
MTNNNKMILKPAEASDLESFLYRFQLDKEASYLAAFTPKDATDKQKSLDISNR